MKKKNVFVVLFALAMVMAGSLLCGNAAPQIDRDSASSVAETAAVASANVKQLDGAGTVNDPYIIEDETDLNDIRNYAVYNTATQSTIISGYFELNSLIILEEDWVQIPATFVGHFEGNGNMIMGLNILVAASNFSSYGLFSINNGTIQNITFSNVSISVASSIGKGKTFSVGVVAGANYGFIENCDVMYSDLDLVGYYSSFLGGIAGCNYGGEISYCEIKDTCSLSGSGHIGGINGYIYTSYAKYCTNRADITYRYDTVKRPAGGIAGALVYLGGVQYCNNYGTLRTTLAYGEGDIQQLVGDFDQNVGGDGLLGSESCGAIVYNNT